MSAPPASTSASSASSTSSGWSTSQGSAGSITAIPPAAWIASAYERESRNASWSQTVQRARSSAAQSPIRGRGASVMPIRAYDRPAMGPTIDLETVMLDRRGGELRITLDRPEPMNAWNKQFGDDLRAAVEHAAADDEVRAVVITGAGRAFSSGADLKAGFEPDAGGPPGRRDRAARALPPDHRRPAADAQAGRWRPSTARRSASAARSRSPPTS